MLIPPSVLCPVDFSDSSLHALSYAMSMAQEADARLTGPIADEEQEQAGHGDAERRHGDRR